MIQHNNQVLVEKTYWNTLASMVTTETRARQIKLNLICVKKNTWLDWNRPSTVYYARRPLFIPPSYETIWLFLSHASVYINCCLSTYKAYCNYDMLCWAPKLYCKHSSIKLGQFNSCPICNNCAYHHQNFRNITHFKRRRRVDASENVAPICSPKSNFNLQNPKHTNNASRRNYTTPNLNQSTTRNGHLRVTD